MALNALDTEAILDFYLGVFGFREVFEAQRAIDGLIGAPPDVRERVRQAIELQPDDATKAKDAPAREE